MLFGDSLNYFSLFDITVVSNKTYPWLNESSMSVNRNYSKKISILLDKKMHIYTERNTLMTVGKMLGLRESLFLFMGKNDI
jgi:hypothetical protein